MSKIDGLKIKIFADGADLKSLLALYREPYIKGFTTNPTLMRKAGISDYEQFSREILKAIPDRPISLEVFADDLAAMKDQALAIASWGPNVNVKVPVTNTKGDFCGSLIRDLSESGVVLNITAIFSLDQVRRVVDSLHPETAAIVSVFAGRVADTGVDPMPLMRKAKELLSPTPKAELLWASPREVFNVIQADECNCDIITATPDILAKLKFIGKGLEEFSLDTVRMFYDDASVANYTIRTK